MDIDTYSNAAGNIYGTLDDLHRPTQEAVLAQIGAGKILPHLLNKITLQQPFLQRFLESLAQHARVICRCCLGTGHVEADCPLKKLIDKSAVTGGYKLEWGQAKYKLWWQQIT